MHLFHNSCKVLYNTQAYQQRIVPAHFYHQGLNPCPVTTNWPPGCMCRSLLPFPHFSTLPTMFPSNTYHRLNSLLNHEKNIVICMLGISLGACWILPQHILGFTLQLSFLRCGVASYEAMIKPLTFQPLLSCMLWIAYSMFVRVAVEADWFKQCHGIEYCNLYHLYCI